jgi:hypothetical protein
VTDKVGFQSRSVLSTIPCLAFAIKHSLTFYFFIPSLAKRENVEAIVEASHYPLSIVMIGVGDGPFEAMEEFDDELPHRLFDNFQFVNYTKIAQLHAGDAAATDEAFAVAALQEIPDQYSLIQKLGLMNKQAMKQKPYKGHPQVKKPPCHVREDAIVKHGGRGAGDEGVRQRPPAYAP